MPNGIIPIKEGSMPPEVAGYMDNARLMHEIVRSMKEIPELESEKPTDTNALTKVEFPQEGGILTYMSNHGYPYRGFPYFEFVEKIDIFKKLSRGILSGLYHSLKKGNRLRIVFMLPLIFVAKDLIFAGLYTYYKVIERLRIKSNLFSKAIRELYRAFDEPRVGEDVETLERRMVIKDILCMILEFDNAYRYRLQDIIVELDQARVKKNTVKEILRLLAIMSQRENDQKVKDTWTLLKIFTKFYLRFDKKLTRILGDVLSNLNLEEMKLQVEDKHFSCQRSDYIFGFMLNPTPEDQVLIDKTTLSRMFNEERGKLDKELTDELTRLSIQHSNEQAKAIRVTPELQKKIQEEIATKQRYFMEKHLAVEQEVSMSYLNQEQKDLIKKQQEEKLELLKKHDLRRSAHAASYGL